MWRLNLIFLFILSTSVVAQTFESGNNRVELVELYTSEGCSSCPPAESWISDLETHPQLFKEFIPVAFHVDYWNYLGWRDKFSKSEFSQRQKRFKSQKLISRVYTPEFVVSGEEWYGWFRGQKSWPKNNTEVGNLKVKIDKQKFFAEYDGDVKDLVLNVSVLGFDFKRDISAGENSGRTLIQDFVVLELDQHKDGLDTWLSLPSSQEKTDKLAYVFWLEEKHDQTPIQATGGFVM